MASNQLTLDTRLRRTAGHLASAVGDDTVVLHGETGMYYGVEGAGSVAWEALVEPVTVAQLRDRIVEAFDVDAARAEADLLPFLEGLVEEGLAEVVDA